MHIYSVTDPEFKPYGKVLEGYDTAELLAAMEKIEMPAEGTAYEPGIDSLEACAVFADFRARAGEKDPANSRSSDDPRPGGGAALMDHGSHIVHAAGAATGPEGDRLNEAIENAGGAIDEVTGKRMILAAFPFRCEAADGGFVRLVAWEEGSF